MGHHPVEDSNRSSNLEFSQVLDKLVSRRTLLQAGAAGATAASGLTLMGCGDSSSSAARPATLGFTPVAKSTADRVAVPAGYKARVLFALGDPLSNDIAAYPNDGSDDGNWDKRAGDHHDALAFYPLPRGSKNSSEGLLVMNHEALTDSYLHAAGPSEDAQGRRPLAEVLKEQYAHGVSVIRVVDDGNGNWSVDRASPLNKRWHVNSEMRLTGPAAGTSFMRTKLSADGVKTFGTLNDCGHGVTPWGTYIAGEENWFAYFTVDESGDNDNLARYGISSGRTGFNYRGWDTPGGGSDLQKRFNLSPTAATSDGDFRNEAHHFGYGAEIDPYTPDAMPRKRTALGRCSHEGVWFAPARPGQPVVAYTGDDSRGEYVYKFVSERLWDPVDANGGLAAGDKYLDAGTLYVARFNEDGTGQWLELNSASTGGMSKAEICIFTRVAADRAGATKMDRPEWGTVDPVDGTVYFTMTNNSASVRSLDDLDAANPRTYEDVNGRTGNVNGHIVRWVERGGRADATQFDFDVFLFGARADDAANINVSGLTADNDFSSPDGIWSDSRGVLWIQTDDGAYTDVTNCMMLAAIPGAVQDGEIQTITSTLDGQSRSVVTRVGASLGADRLARFLVGPKECEITGVDMTPDNRTMFVNVQHPGERGDHLNPTSNWPSGSGDATQAGSPGSRPRTATIVITREDGGEIAL